MKQLVIFDWDGTLMDSTGVIIVIFSSTISSWAIVRIFSFLLTFPK